MKLRCFTVLFLATLCAISVSALRARSNNHIWSTWQYVELDKAASAWLIKRFVDRGAQFKIFKTGALIREGRAFDTPDSELRRDRNGTTFDSILRKYKIHDPSLDYIAKIVWDIEVNVWDKKITPESRGLNAIVRGLSRISKNDVDCLQRSWLIFDALYAEVKSRR